MARPIKETPVVTGKDAKRFAEKIAHLKPESIQGSIYILVKNIERTYWRDLK